MILDRIQYRSFYCENAALNSVLEAMAAVGRDDFPSETILLDGEQAYINPVCFTTKPEAECLFEAHRRYADVHYIVEGCEKIVVSDLSGVAAKHAYNEEKDIGFYTGDQGTACVLHAGDFLVCFPQDAHKVAIAAGAPAPVKKLVGKIRV